MVEALGNRGTRVSRGILVSVGKSKIISQPYTLYTDTYNSLQKHSVTSNTFLGRLSYSKYNQGMLPKRKLIGELFHWL